MNTLSPVKLESFSGTHHEIGVQQGTAVRELLHQTIRQFSNFPELKIAKPRFIPMSLFLPLAKRQAIKNLKHDIPAYYPKQAERMKGIAEGADLDLSWIYFSQAMELLVDFGASMVRVPACTSLGFTPERTTTNETIIGKNFDFPNHFLPLNLNLQAKPNEGYQTLGCTMAPLPGIIDGMNEYGLIVTHNTAFTTEKPTNFVPNTIVIQEMLETCKNTHEAIEFLTEAKHAGNALLMIGDAEGDIRSMEVSHNHAAIRKSIEGQIINTNHYHTEEMQKYEIPHNAVFTEKTGTEWAGKRLHQSSEERLKRAQEMLNSCDKITENMIMSVLRDHGKENHPSNLTVCQHGTYNSTLRSVIFYPNTKIMKVLYGNSCQNKYVDFSFS